MIDLGDFVTLDRNTLVTDSRRVARHFARLNFELYFEINRLALGGER